LSTGASPVRHPHQSPLTQHHPCAPPMKNYRSPIDVPLGARTTRTRALRQFASIRLSCRPAGRRRCRVRLYSISDRGTAWGGGVAATAHKVSLVSAANPHAPEERSSPKQGGRSTKGPSQRNPPKPPDQIPTPRKHSKIPERKTSALFAPVQNPRKQDPTPEPRPFRTAKRNPDLPNVAIHQLRSSSGVYRPGARAAPIALPVMGCTSKAVKNRIYGNWPSKWTMEAACAALGEAGTARSRLPSIVTARARRAAFPNPWNASYDIRPSAVKLHARDQLAATMQAPMWSAHWMSMPGHI